MSIDRILDEWEKDSEIGLEIAQEASRTPSLHAKYLRMYARERAILKRLKAEYDALYSDMMDYYLGEMDPEDMENLGLDPYPRRVLKNDVKRFLDRDKRLFKKRMEIAISEEKVEALKSILEQISQRTFLLNSAMKYLKFTQGEM